MNKMTIEEFEQLKNALVETVKITVNGKIDRMNSKLDTYIKEDNEWKERAEPVIKMGNNAKGASIVVLWLAGVIIAIGGAWQILRDIFKK